MSSEFERRHVERYRKIMYGEMTLAEAVAEHDRDWHEHLADERPSRSSEQGN